MVKGLLFNMFLFMKDFLEIILLLIVIFFFGFIMMVLLILIFIIGIFFDLLFVFRIVIVFGCSLISFFNVEEVLFFVFFLSSFLSKINVIMIVVVLK